jgi:hypothetical protein
MALATDQMLRREHAKLVAVKLGGLEKNAHRHHHHFERGKMDHGLKREEEEGNNKQINHEEKGKAQPN